MDLKCKSRGIKCVINKAIVAHFLIQLKFYLCLFSLFN